VIVLDSETTGLVQPELTPLDQQPRMIEVAALKLDDTTLEEVDHYHALINPKMLLPEIITQITGLRDSDLVGAKPFAAHYEPLVNLFLGERSFAAHNASFDRDILRFDLMRIGKLVHFPWPPVHLCTVELTQHIKGKYLNLAALFKHYLGEQMQDAHRALSDTRNLARCIREMRKEKLL
jgi:DNA polymerase III epsilon subunit-like protein